MLDRTATLALWHWAQGGARVARPDPAMLLKGAAAWSRFGIRDPSLLSDPEGAPIVAEDGAYTLYFNARDAPIDRGGVTRVGRAVGGPPALWRIDPEPAFADGRYAAHGSVVRVAPDDHRLYYSFDTSRGFAIARSENGLVWERMAGPALLRPEQFGASLIGLPHVSRQDDVWVMLFEGFVGGQARLFMALSGDGLAWEPAKGGNPIYTPEGPGWDAFGQANPSLVRLCPGLGVPRFTIIYNGESVAHGWEVGALFADLIGGPWRGLPEPLLRRGSPGSWDGGRLEGGRLVVGRPDGLGMLFFGLPSADSYADGQIGFAMIEGEERATRRRNLDAERRYNDDLSTRYFDIWDRYPVQRLMHEIEARWLDELVAERARVLILGSGAGRELPALLAKHCRIAAVDISPAMLERGRARFGVAGVDWIEADIAELPDFPEVFDAGVMLGGVINYLPEPSRCLENVRARLAPGGLIVIGAINLDHPGEERPRHELPDGRVRALYNPKQLTALCEAAGFRVSEQRGVRYFIDQLPAAWLRADVPADAAPIVEATLRLEEQLVGRLPPDRAKFIWTIARAA